MPILPLLAQGGAFLQQNWKFFGILVVVIACYCYINGLQNTITDLNGKVADAATAYTALETTSKNNEDNLKKAIQEQNDAIDKHKKQLEDANAKIVEIQAEYDKRDKAHRLKIQQLLKTPVPTTCPGAIDYLIEHSDGLQWTE